MNTKKIRKEINDILDLAQKGENSYNVRSTWIGETVDSFYFRNKEQATPTEWSKILIELSNLVLILDKAMKHRFNPVSWLKLGSAVLKIARLLFVTFRDKEVSNLPF